MFPINDDAPKSKDIPFVNYGLIGLNVIIFIYEAIVTSYFSNNLVKFELFSNYGAIPNLLLAGKNPFSLFSSMFMHASLVHLIGNMFFLYVFGDNLEGRFGHSKYLIIYLIMGVIASYAQSIYSVSTGSGNVPAIGASGAISGVLAAYLIFYPRSKIHTIIFAFLITVLRIPALVFVPIWFIMQLIFALIGQSGGVAYLAHIGGFLAGLAAAYIWKFVEHIFKNPFSQKTELSNTIPNTSEIIIEDPLPEIIRGTNFIDVIVNVKTNILISEIHAKIDSSSSILLISIPKIDKSYSISLPKFDNFAKILSTSINNGIIKIRITNIP
ncbi:MAG TPA: rhomboid family intramembrane serine protease [Candidatus Nitrosocosmicus sp.]